MHCPILGLYTHPLLSNLDTLYFFILFYAFLCFFILYTFFILFLYFILSTHPLLSNLDSLLSALQLVLHHGQRPGKVVRLHLVIRRCQNLIRNIFTNLGIVIVNIIMSSLFHFSSCHSIINISWISPQYKDAKKCHNILLLISNHYHVKSIFLLPGTL